EGQDGSGERSVGREDGGARAFRETARPVADGDELQPAVVLEVLDLRAEGVEMGDHRTRGLGIAPRHHGADGAAPGELVGDAEAFELGGHEMHDLVRIARGTRDRKQRMKRLLQIAEIDHGPGHAATSFWMRWSRFAEWGNSRSMKRSAVGCGSWLARPGRSLASMMT